MRLDHLSLGLVAHGFACDRVELGRFEPAQRQLPLLLELLFQLTELSGGNEEALRYLVHVRVPHLDVV